ncbi:hypothetical protein, partial [Enterococcus faecium]
PMLVFETIFSVVWGCVYASELPSLTLFVGMVLLVSGVVYALTLFNSLQKNEISDLNRSEL